jgi:hypothetical protein
MSSTPQKVVLAETWEEVSDATKRLICEVFAAGEDGVFTESEKGRIAVRAIEVLEGGDMHQVSVTRATATFSVLGTLGHSGPDSEWFLRKVTEIRRDMSGTVPDTRKSPDPLHRIEALVTR